MTVLAEAPVRVPTAAVGLVISCLEALLGRRALHQIRESMSEEAFRSLAHNRIPILEVVSLGRLRMQMPHADAVEAVASICWGGRWLACTVRLDAPNRGQWRCTGLDVVGRR